VTEQPAPSRPLGTAETVELTIPADAAYVSVLRTVTASLAARRDFTLDEIDDLRIAVDEASSLLLPLATPQSQLTASFDGGDDSLTVRVSINAVPITSDPDDAAGGGLAERTPDVDETSFAWMVLAALADEVHTERSRHEVAVLLLKTRSARIS
jgi:serine/threonine-protein kinase RsbW